MTEIIHDHDGHGSSSALMVVIVILVIAVGGFLFWRFSANNTQPKSPDVINVQVTPPATTP